MRTREENQPSPSQAGSVPVASLELVYPPPQADCRSCQGEGYTITARGEIAFAERCDCGGPCDRCEGSGIARVRLDGALRAGHCRCKRIDHRIRLFNHARIPARHANSSFDNFDFFANPRAVAAYRTALGWVADYQPGVKLSLGLVFWGMVGRGKTHLLVAILRALVFQHGVSVRFIEFSHLLALLKASFGSRGPRRSAPRRTEESDILDNLVSAHILAVDELGKGRLTDWELSVIDGLVSRRYNGLGCMFGTSNYRPGISTDIEVKGTDTFQQTLGDRVGPRVYSRLTEMSLFVHTSGIDYRKHARPAPPIPADSSITYL